MITVEKMPNLNMKKARERAGYSQKQIALTLHVSTATVSNWESGKICPTAANLKQLSSLYKVSSDYLLGLTSDPAFIPPLGGENGDKRIRCWYPINMLSAQYHVSADTLASILGCDLGRAEELSLSFVAATEEELAIVADFFELDLDELKNGILPLFPKKSVQTKLDVATKRLFAAYGDIGEYSSEQIEAIDAFMKVIRSQHSPKKGGEGPSDLS